MLSIKWVGAYKDNYQVGRNGHAIKGFVIHATQGSLQSAANWFNNPASKVSAHYGIAKNGSIEQYVSDSDIAFHAGNWLANQTTIGIEFEDIKDGIEPTEAQYKACVELIKAKARLYSINLSADTIQPHFNFRATECPADVDVNKIINLALELEKPKRFVRLYEDSKEVKRIGVPEGKKIITQVTADGTLHIDVR